MMMNYLQFEHLIFSTGNITYCFIALLICLGDIVSW